VDPSIQSLNLFTENVNKAEALSAEIDSILQGSGQSRKSLITFVQPVASPVEPSSRYNRGELYEQVWTVRMRELAPVYGVSESGLRKACTRLRIPMPGHGYWARKAANQPVVPPPPLPEVPVQTREKRYRGQIFGPVWRQNCSNVLT